MHVKLRTTQLLLLANVDTLDSILKIYFLPEHNLYILNKILLESENIHFFKIGSKFKLHFEFMII